MPRPPKFQPRRTNARVGPLTLPITGRDGPLPKWPLTGQSASETKYWKELWKKPQAIAWAVELLKRCAEYSGSKGILIGVEDDGGPDRYVVCRRAGRVVQGCRRAVYRCAG